MGIDTTFWPGKRVFVTGHTGFKGSWLSLWLAELGADVIGYSLAAPTTPNLFEIARVYESLCAHHEGDILDVKKLRTTLTDAKPDIVLHLAAQSLVRKSYEEPLLTYATNIMGTAHVLEAAHRARSVKAVVVVTSDKCYENSQSNHRYRENEPLGGSDPYSASKACAELVTASYRSTLNSTDGARIHVASARAGNVIGGGDWATDRLIPDCVRAFLQNQPVELRYPNAVRPWQHVLEPLSGYLQLAQALMRGNGADYASPWNFGPAAESEARVEEVAAAVAGRWNTSAKVRIARAQAERHEASQLRLDSSKAVTELGWQPRWGLSRSLDETVKWYRAWVQGEDMRGFCLMQLDAYLRDAE